MVPLHKDSQEDICPICLDPLKEAVSTDCRHLFCRMCLTQHMDKASVSGVLSCPVCRKPYSEGVLGDGYICYSHQKRVCSFCETSRHLLCVECLRSPEHQSHTELSIENAISHYKTHPQKQEAQKRPGDLQRLKAQERRCHMLCRTNICRCARNYEVGREVLCEEFSCFRSTMADEVDWESHRLRAELQNQDQTKEHQQEDLPAEVAKMFNFSEAVTQLNILASGLERMARELDASTLKDASDLLDRSAPQKLEGLLSHLPPASPNLN